MLPTEEQVNGGIVAAAVLAMLLVALRQYGHRCRHLAVRFFVWGASIVFLPLTFSIISSLLDRSREPKCDGTLPPSGKQNPESPTSRTCGPFSCGSCSSSPSSATPMSPRQLSPQPRPRLTAATSTSTGRGSGLPVELVAQYAWAAFLIRLCVPLAGWLGRFNIAIFIAFSVLGLAKVALNLAAFWRASDSFALGPRQQHEAYCRLHGAARQRRRAGGAALHSDGREKEARRGERLGLPR